MPLTFDILIVKVVTESHATWATYVPILAYLGLSVRVIPDARDRWTSDKSNSMPQSRGGHITMYITHFTLFQYFLFNAHDILVITWKVFFVIISHCCKTQQAAQLMLTNDSDAFGGQPRSPNTIPCVRYSFLFCSSNCAFQTRPSHDIRLQKMLCP